MGFVTKTDPILWADKNVVELGKALKNMKPDELNKYNSKSDSAA